jgi:hypothetical protein
MTLLHIDRSQKLLSLLTRRKAANLAIVGIVLGRVRRAKHYKLTSIGFDNYGQIVTVYGRGVAGAAMRAIVVTRAGPSVGPFLTASIADVVVQKPGHASLLKIASDSYHVTRNR